MHQFSAAYNLIKDDGQNRRSVYPMRKQPSLRKGSMPQPEAKPYFLLAVLRQLHLISRSDLQTEE